MSNVKNIFLEHFQKYIQTCGNKYIYIYIYSFWPFIFDLAFILVIHLFLPLSLSLSLSKIDFVYFSSHESHVPLLLVLSILTADGS